MNQQNNQQCGLVTEIRAEVRFPFICTSEPLKELWIERQDETILPTCMVPLSEPLVDDSNWRDLSACQVRQVIERSEEQGGGTVVATVEGSGDSLGVLAVGRSTIELYCSWLSFLSSWPFRVLSWGQAVERDQTTGKGTDIPFPFAAYPCDGLPPHGEGWKDNLEVYGKRDLTPWLNYPMVHGLDTSLYWLKRGSVALRPEDKLIFYTTAVESISEALEQEDPQQVKCPECGHQFPPGLKVSKTGVLKLLKHLGYSRTKIWEPIWRARSKFIHGGILDNQRQFSERLRLLADSAKALATLAISYYLFRERKDIKFLNRNEILKREYECEHPARGPLAFLRRTLDKLASSAP